ncbi:Caspase-7 like protein [Argiope bruennichi]|uniref:Caspase-7 like protein n=1 Tax=Argiope bruennichi TaxID=94029 RepID=A0A8T0G2L4_ARGBR|nr:Caspase-7 like protein [Argiope bruennichi]
MDTEQIDSVDIAVDEQLSEIFINKLSLANPVISLVDQQVSLRVEDCQKNESKEGDCHIFNYQEFISRAPRKGSEKDAKRLKHDFFNTLFAEFKIGPAAQRSYAERYPTRRIPSHNFFARLHQRLAETSSLERALRDRVRTTRTADAKQNVLQHVQGNSRTSTRSVANAVGVSHCSVWRILRAEDMHSFHVQRVQTQKPEDYVPRIAFEQCQNILWAKDRSMNIDDILTIFSESSSLKGIPKIFIIQACRGTEAELAAPMESTDSSLLTETEEYLDFLIVNSTYLDTVSFKTSDEEEDKCHGSFFINEFCHSLEQFSDTLDLFEILTDVNYRMANIFLSHNKKNIEYDEKKQMPCFFSTLRKEVKFNKKIEKFETVDTQYFEKRRKRHGSGNDRTIYPLSDFKYDIKKAKRVFFLSVVNEKIGEGVFPFRRANPFFGDKRLLVFSPKITLPLFTIDWPFIERSSNLVGARNESNAKKSSEVDCLICYIAAYSRYDSICDVKGKKISKKEVVEKFIGQQNKSFVGKPKIFIFLLRKLLENEKLPDERFCDFESSVESNVKSKYSGKGYGISTDSAGEIDKQSTDKKFDTGIESTDGGMIGENLIPVHADILEICITVTDWKHVIEPMGLLSKMLKENRSEDLLSLLTKYNFELVEKHNFFEIPTTISSSYKRSKNSFSVTSTLTKTLFWP